MGTSTRAAQVDEMQKQIAILDQDSNKAPVIERSFGEETLWKMQKV